MHPSRGTAGDNPSCFLKQPQNPLPISQQASVSEGPGNAASLRRSRVEDITSSNGKRLRSQCGGGIGWSYSQEYNACDSPSKGER